MGMIESGRKRHKRNRYLFMVLFLLLFLSDIFLPSLFSLYASVKTKEQAVGLQVILNTFLGLFAVPLFIWYALTLEFVKRWWIFLAVGIFSFVGALFFVYSWSILFFVLEMKGYQLTQKNIKG